MKAGRYRGGSRGLTTVEVLVILAMVAILASLLLPMLARPKVIKRINCASSIKQIGLALRMWAHDHSDRFPMQVSTNGGGTLEFSTGGATFRHFLVLSNELVSPKVLKCSSDPERQRATSFWPPFSNSNVSYFVGLDARLTSPEAILLGDRGITGGTMTVEGITYFRTNSLADWASGFHSGGGNLGFADGSVQGVNGVGLRRLLQQQGREFIRLELPETTR